VAWLGTDALPIGAGWGGAPQLHAAPIGDLVSSILKNRQFQQQFTQKNIADAIKEYQARREGGAFIKAAQAANLLPAGDLGDLGGKGPESAAALATLIRQKEAEQGQVGLRKAQETYYKNLGGEPKTWTDEFGNVHVIGPRGGVSAPLKRPVEDTAAKLAKDVKAITGGYSLSDIQGGYEPTYNETGQLTTKIPQMVKNKAGQFEKAVTLPDGTTAALSDVVAQQKEEYKNLPTATKPITLPPDISKRYRKLIDPNYAPPADTSDTGDTGGGDGGGGGRGARNFPPAGTKGTHNGQPVISDGYGWLPDPNP
jgi:hypothetical protein